MSFVYNLADTEIFPNASSKGKNKTTNYEVKKIGLGEYLKLLLTKYFK